MVVGEFSKNIDEKGRVVFPFRLRDDFGERFYVTRWLDSCIAAYPMEEWNRIVERIGEQPSSAAKAINRYFFSNAEEVTPDKQGRILLPKRLIEHAGLKKDVVVVGAGTHAEIWDRDAWEANCAAINSEDIEKQMIDLGI